MSAASKNPPPTPNKPHVKPHVKYHAKYIAKYIIAATIAVILFMAYGYASIIWYSYPWRVTLTAISPDPLTETEAIDLSRRALTEAGFDLDALERKTIPFPEKDAVVHFHEVPASPTPDAATYWGPPAEAGYRYSIRINKSGTRVECEIYRRL